MKLHRRRDNKKSGIYQIKNLVNNKIYIGRSTTIYDRIRRHINGLNKRSKDENIHLIRAWHKYKRISFEYSVLEYCLKEELYEKELSWIAKLEANNRKIGYNIRIDSENKYIISEETRKRLSEAQKKRFANKPEEKLKTSQRTIQFWKDNPEKKKRMSEKVSNNHTKYKIYQYDKETNKLIKVWTRLIDIIKKNPTYKKHNIYAVCSGEKPSMYGYIWKKKLI